MADRLAMQLGRSFHEFAEAVVPLGVTEVLQEQMLDNVANAHPHRIFARRLEKSNTIRKILGQEAFEKVLARNRYEVVESMKTFIKKVM